jgi:hypothetical protein
MTHYGEIVTTTVTCEHCQSKFDVQGMHSTRSYCQSCEQELARPEYVDTELSLSTHNYTEHDVGYIEATITLRNNNPVSIAPDVRPASDPNRDDDDVSGRIGIIGWIRFETGSESVGAAEQPWIQNTRYQDNITIRPGSTLEMSFRWSESQIIQEQIPADRPGGALGSEFRQRVCKHEGDPMNAENIHVLFQPTNTDFFENTTATTTITTTTTTKTEL